MTHKFNKLQTFKFKTPGGRCPMEKQFDVEIDDRLRSRQSNLKQINLNNLIKTLIQLNLLIKKQYLIN